MSKKKTKLLIALITIALCICMVVGGTYALFTDKVILTNHLKAGELNITLVRTNLTTTTLDEETGYLKTVESTPDVDFTNETAENVFGLTSDTKIVPQCSFEAMMEVSNNSDVAFSYSLEIVLDGDAKELSDQIELSVTVNGVTTTNKLSEGYTVENVATLAINQTSEFVVKILFLDLDSEVNNAAQNQEVNFDLIVSAIQVTQAPVVQE